MEINREIKNITSAFVLEDNLTECVPYGSGHINDTYRLTYGTGKHYILQKMNRSIFTKPVELMENVSGVTAWLKKKIQENGGDVERETLNLVMTKDGLPYYVDEDGEYWRVYLFIENATCYDMVICFPHYGNPKVFRITCQTGIKYPIKTLQYSITQKQTVAKCFLCFCLFLFRSYYRLLFTPFTIPGYLITACNPE